MHYPAARFLLAFALCLPAPLLAQDAPAPLPDGPVLDLDQRLLLRCAATFALVANRQQAGEPWALELPALGDRAREFFVLAGARVMHETGLDQGGIASLLRAEAQSLVTHGQTAEMMAVCLPVLEEAGL